MTAENPIINGTSLFTQKLYKNIWMGVIIHFAVCPVRESIKNTGSSRWLVERLYPDFCSA